MKTEVIEDPRGMRATAIALKLAGKRIAVVPTMGALHEGHRTLIREARAKADILIVTIFVNPTQFAPNEDFGKYPRTFEADRAMCESEGADFIFAPADAAMYPTGYSTYVTVEKLSGALCGVTRPAHFRGVATVVAKLLNTTQADVAVFGWKDAQQLLIIRRMVEDLDMPVEIVGVETVRAEDGLALSSRNKYLSPEDRAEAPVLHRALQNARSMVEKKETLDAAVIRGAILHQIETESKGRPDYVEVVSMDTLEPLREIEPGNTLIALACYWGSTRLIDSVRL